MNSKPCKRQRVSDFIMNPAYGFLHLYEKYEQEVQELCKARGVTLFKEDLKIKTAEKKIIVNFIAFIPLMTSF